MKSEEHKGPVGDHEHTNKHTMTVPEGKKIKKGVGKIFKDITAKKILNLMKDESVHLKSSINNKKDEFKGIHTERVLGKQQNRSYSPHTRDPAAIIYIFFN